MLQYREWKTVWENKEIRIGRCRIMKTKVPVVKHRTTKKALYANSAYPSKMGPYIRKLIMKCLISASVTTSVLLIVTSGVTVSVAKIAWSAAFLECIELTVDDSARCIIHDLDIVTEKGGWRVGL